ncbi:hypothetical protein IJ579_03895, partial [bacterium]|nr:hypothetical protein [bacterium]
MFNKHARKLRIKNSQNDGKARLMDNFKPENPHYDCISTLWGGGLTETLTPCAFAAIDSVKNEELQDFTWGATQQTQATGELQPSGKCRLGLLPQHVKFPSPLVGEGLGVRGATHTITPPLKKLPSLAREGLRVGLFPARGK